MSCYVIGNWVYATDSFTMCRIRKDRFTELEMEKIEMERQAMGRLEKSYPEKSPDFFDIKTPEPHQAPQLKAKMQLQEIPAEYFVFEDEIVEGEDCPECEGDGTKECWHCWHSEECDNCDWSGKLGRRTGKKIRTTKKRMLIGDVCIAGDYFTKVNDAFREYGADHCMITVNTQQLDPVKFELDGMEIIVMPLRIDEPEKAQCIVPEFTIL